MQVASNKVRPRSCLLGKGFLIPPGPDVGLHLHLCKHVHPWYCSRRADYHVVQSTTAGVAGSQTAIEVRVLSYWAKYSRYLSDDDRIRHCILLQSALPDERTLVACDAGDGGELYWEGELVI